MYIIHEATIKQPNGIFDVCVVVIDKDKKHTYTYPLTSEKDVRSFEFLYKKGRTFHGKALVLLNKNKLKEEKREDGL